jgi:hypothetical protein
MTESSPPARIESVGRARFFPGHRAGGHLGVFRLAVTHMNVRQRPQSVQSGRGTVHDGGAGAGGIAHHPVRADRLVDRVGRRTDGGHRGRADHAALDGAGAAMRWRRPSRLAAWLLMGTLIVTQRIAIVHHHAGRFVGVPRHALAVIQQHHGAGRGGGPGKSDVDPDDLVYLPPTGGTILAAVVIVCIAWSIMRHAAAARGIRILRWSRPRWRSANSSSFRNWS